MNLRRQAIVLSVVPLVFLLLLLVIASVLQRETESNAVWSRRSAEALTASDRITRTLTKANGGVAAYVKKRRPQLLGPYYSAAADMPKRIAALRDQVRDQPQQYAIATRLGSLTTDVMKLYPRYIAYVRAGKKAAADAMVGTPAVTRLTAAWTATKNQFDETERANTIARDDALHKNVQVLGQLLLVTAFAGIVLTLFVMIRFGLQIARRLRRLAENARLLGLGQSSEPIGGHDEITDLDAVYHEMTQRLQQTLHEREDALAAYQREHAVASTLQRALLPQALPSIGGLRIDTAYVPAASDAEIGGDWYDVFQVSARTVGISIGDVAGHGLRAATIMGSVRQSIRTAARDATEPSTVLQRVNRVLCADEENAIVTAFFALLSLEDGTLRYATAGHPQPLVVREGGNAQMLEGSGFLLGVDSRTMFTDYSIHIDVGSGILLYTDGIVEVERDYLGGMEHLKDAFTAEYLDSSTNIAQGVQERIFARALPHDDSAILFIGVTSLGADPPVPDRQVWTIDARDEQSVYRVKRALLWQLGGFAPSAQEFGAVEAILGELLSNVARHTPGPANVTLARNSRHFLLEVDDEGPPFVLNGSVAPDLLAESGRGMFLIRAFARDVHVERRASGNRVSVVLPMPETVSS
jgi:serine phosphatase RsbU (regulator of sigma subunit)/CHASE3 domain sensor protein/anti-sigma regulatory factor (Ser/Thr protein kinase)